MVAEPKPPPPEGLDQQIESVYPLLRKLASQAIKGRAGAQILEPTELVHELYIKLAKSRRDGLPRTELLALSASVLRSVLVDHARARATLKRGGLHRHLTLSGETLVQREPVDVLVLHDSLTKLASLDARMARVAELRFFAGLEVDEIARILDVSPRTVDSEWSLAKAWLHREIAP